MGMKDRAKDLKDKAMHAVSGEQVDQAADKIDDATGKQHSGKIDKGQEMAKEQLDKHRHEQGR